MLIFGHPFFMVTILFVLLDEKTVGANQAHTNMQPYLGMNYCIALNGEWPSRE